MSLRARLLLSLAGLLAVALIAAGALVVGVTRASLVAEVDSELRSVGLPRVDRPGGVRDPDDPTGRRVAFLLLDPTGQVITAIPSGYADRPDPLPSMPSFSGGLPPELAGEIVDRASADGSVRYRVLFQPGPGGRSLALAAPLAAVDAAIGDLTRNLLLIGGGGLVAIIAIGWVVVRRGLRPIERIALTADAIAAGDLSPRVDLPHDRSEVGRLGTAFDAMLDQIQAAFDEQRAALEAKDRSERRLRQFVGDASHELRTPLTALRGYADLYRTGGLEHPAALDHAMSRIGTESLRMAALVEDLLLLARLDQGRPLRRDPVGLSAIVEDAVADARAVEPDRTVAASIVPGIIVTGDEDRLRQVVGNLLANVRVHTPRGAPVSVALAPVDDRAELRVTDRGPGVDPQHAERIFDRFYRGHLGRSPNRGGSGLGLSIATSVADAHGGSVRHEPTPGGGATFVVSLPLAAGTGRGAAADHPPRSPGETTAEGSPAEGAGTGSGAFGGSVPAGAFAAGPGARRPLSATSQPTPRSSSGPPSTMSTTQVDP